MVVDKLPQLAKTAKISADEDFLCVGYIIAGTTTTHNVDKSFILL